MSALSLLLALSACSRDPDARPADCPDGVEALLECYDEATFDADYLTAFCAKMAECRSEFVAYYVGMGLDEWTATDTYETAYTAACETEWEDTGTPDPTCHYQRTQGLACVVGLLAVECSAYEAMGFGFPQACSRLYVCIE